jgi:hypothetical protein
MFMLPQNHRMQIPTATRDRDVMKRIVLHADNDTFDALARSVGVRLRLFCEQGSAVSLDLHNKGKPANNAGDLHLVTLCVSTEHLLASLDANVEVQFKCKRDGRVAQFEVLSLCQDTWFGGRLEPMDECRQ